MAYRIRRIDYYHVMIEEEPGAACAMLSRLAELGVNLAALAALPLGPMRTQLTLFPDEAASMEKVANDAGMVLDGPHPAILVQGDDELGALAGVHEKLAGADVSAFASIGVSDGRGDYGYVVYVRPEEIDRAMSSLEA